MIKIAVDAMGGDNAPLEIVKGSVKFVNEYKNAKLYLFGDETAVKNVLGTLNYNNEQIEVIHTTEIIENEEKPTIAIKEKKDSSLVQAIKMVKSGEASGVISAGSTGALLTGATVMLGRIKGVKRPTLVTMIPAAKGKKFLLADSGANVDSKPEYVAQFAVLASIYAEKMLGIKNPTVGLVNVGVEEEKGDTFTKEAFVALKQEKINFVGNVEAREIPLAAVDIVVCDGFVGNVVLKLYEGLGKMFKGELESSLRSRVSSKIGYLFARKSLNGLKDTLSTKDSGGAPLIGLKGLAVKAHGNSKEHAFYTGLKECYYFIEKDITKDFENYFAKGERNE